MQIRIRTLAFMIFLFPLDIGFSQNPCEDNYAFFAITSVLKESPEGKILANNAEATELSFRQQDRTWLPSIRLDISADAQLVQGDYHYIRNQGVLPGPQIIAEPTASIGIYQRLPGNGQLTIGAGYGFSYLAGHNAYIQKPYLQLGITQGLSGGAFFLSKDPASELLEKQKDIFFLELKEAKFNLAVAFITAVQDYNLALLEHESRLSALKKAEAEYREQEKRREEGQRNEIELFNAHMSRTQALQNYQLATQGLMETETILSTYGVDDIAVSSGIFMDGILELLNESFGEKSETSMREEEIQRQIGYERLTLEIEKAKTAPSLYIKASITPDQGRNGEYGDLSRSLRDIADLSRDWTVSATVGLSLNLDFSSQLGIQKRATEKRLESLMLQLEVLTDEQSKLRKIYGEWNVAFPSYCEEMKKNMEEEGRYMEDIRILFERKQITEAELLVAEAGYCEIRLNYNRSIWNMIQGKLNVLKLSSDWEEFIGQFMEVLK